MKHNIPDRLLSQLSEFVAAETALHFPKNRWDDLEHRTNSAAEEFGFTDKEAFIQWLVSSPLTTEQIEILASHLTTPETYFWREPQIFEALQKHILPELIRSRKNGERRLRIWSAGCASGEEPYSIAIALRRVIPAGEDWHISILATDINPRILRKAATGIYTEWSFRNAPVWLKKEYFRRNEDGRFEIRPDVRKMVIFTYLNLAEDIYPSPLNNTNAMDLIFCRNVLMYFSPEHAVLIAQSLHRSLLDGGWLIVGACELSHQIFPQFMPVNFPGAIAYRKGIQEFCLPPDFHFEEIPRQAAPVESLLDGSARLKRMAQAIEVPSWQETAHPESLHPGTQERNEAVTDKREDEEIPPDIARSIRALADQGRLEEALAACEEAIIADKLDPGLHYFRATILQEQDRDSEAIASLKHALYLEPDFVLAHFAMGNLVLRQGNRQRAKKCFENVLALLSICGQDEILPESEGLRADRLGEITRATMQVWD